MAPDIEAQIKRHMEREQVYKWCATDLEWHTMDGGSTPEIRQRLIDAGIAEQESWCKLAEGFPGLWQDGTLTKWQNEAFAIVMERRND